MGRIRLVKMGLLASVLVAAAGCSAPHGYMTVEGSMLGTTLRATGDVRTCSQGELYRAIMEIDRQMKSSMSIFDSTSLLSRLNANLTDTLDPHIDSNLRLARRINRLSGGAYDVTVKPLVEAYGFAGHDADARIDVDSILAFVGDSLLTIRNGRLVKADPRVQIDLNSVAKGYTVDCVAELMERCGAENYLVDIGGEIRCRGRNPHGEAWRIGIETPFDGNMSQGEFLLTRIGIEQGGMATSGNYRRFYIDGQGRKVAHTIDPRTGRSALSDLLSVTVVAESCAEADALGTMFLTLGDEQALELAERMQGVRALFILASDDGYRIHATPAMRPLILSDNPQR